MNMTLASLDVLNDCNVILFIYVKVEEGAIRDLSNLEKGANSLVFILNHYSLIKRNVILILKK